MGAQQLKDAAASTMKRQEVAVDNAREASGRSFIAVVGCTMRRFCEYERGKRRTKNPAQDVFHAAEQRRR